MTDFSSARNNMVISQLYPNGVVSEAILNAFRVLPRELFVPETDRAHCYMDDGIQISPTRFLMEPVLFARMVEALSLCSTDHVLDIGGGAGYSAAVLSKICNHVTSYEPDALLQSQANESWKAAGCEKNIATTDSLTFQPETFDAIILNGACETVPKNLLNALKPGGRLVAVQMASDLPSGQVIYYLKNTGGIVSSRVLFEACAPYLPGFEPEQKFVF